MAKDHRKAVHRAINYGYIGLPHSDIGASVVPTAAYRDGAWVIKYHPSNRVALRRR
jgi:hypothetical protein